MAFVQHYAMGMAANRALTHPSLHLRDAHDAQLVLEAVRRNQLPLIKRRLVASERDQLKAGNVFVWEEADDEGGLLRWTDGRRWSQSRMRGDYLFYEEKVETTQDEREAKAARRAQRAADPSAVIPPPVRRKDRPSKLGGLTKQTYSAVVYPPGSKEGRKWHVVAYFLSSDYAKLPTIDKYEELRSLQIPKGAILTTKTVPLRTERLSEVSDEMEICDRHSIPRSSASVSPTPTSPASSFSLPELDSLALGVQSDGGRSPRRKTISSLAAASAAPYPRRPAILRSMSDSATAYMLPPPRRTLHAPLTSEDRRALSSFRISF
ncbi:hypothetical protein CYLTODRAFT_422586 [Cylindrobasidium torrendii FP15055 ss-10]|uniref:Gti1/Pac2 family-domain-containing protein n=1 Tax=Cylindrobasidium torrendii FP15055 ss-10 TaxID=1314674 RepID=A0A0D7BA34_9AGAR|nr:hypothetical protein CYLTODRAFT_422586 [Cylindrobasidium torrendii FP15055 ss-10]